MGRCLGHRWAATCTVECRKMPRPLSVKSAQRLYGRGWCNMHSTLVCVETTFSSACQARLTVIKTHTAALNQ